MARLGVYGLELLLEIEVEGRSHLVLVDSGASLSVMQPGVSDAELRPTQTVARGLTGNKFKTTGIQAITFRRGSKTFKHEFLIARLVVDYSGILGVDILRRMEVRVDLWTSTLVLGRTSHRLTGQEVERCALINRQPQAVGEASGMGLVTPEPTIPKASVGTPIPGLSTGGSDIRSWEVVASGPVVLPPLSQGIVVGKMRKTGDLDVPREVLVEPVGLGTPGAYVARVPSRVYAQEELGTLSDLGEWSDRRTSSSRDKSKGELKVNSVSADGKGLSLQASAGNTTRYCVLKILNTSRQHFEVGKNVKLGTTETILRCAPRVTGFDSRKLEAEGTSTSIVNVIRGHNSSELHRFGPS